MYTNIFLTFLLYPINSADHNLKFISAVLILYSWHVPLRSIRNLKRQKSLWGPRFKMDLRQLVVAIRHDLEYLRWISMVGFYDDIREISDGITDDTILNRSVTISCSNKTWVMDLGLVNVR